MANPDIRRAIDAARDQIAERAGLTVERVYREISRLAFFDPRRMADAEGRPIPLHELDDDTAAAISGLEVEQLHAGAGSDRVEIGVVRKYKIADKNAALDKAAKILGLYAKDNEQAGTAAGKAAAAAVAIAIRFVDAPPVAEANVVVGHG